MPWLKSLGLINKFAVYSAIFRLYISFHLLKDLFVIIQYKGLLFEGTSFYEVQPTYLTEIWGIRTEYFRENIDFFLSGYTLLILLLFLGIGRQLTVVLLFILYELFQRLSPMILNGGDNLLKFCILYMCLIDSFQYFSLSQKKVKTPPQFSLQNFLSNLGGISICMHLCLVYFVSAIHKIHTDIWFNGVATYYTLSMERFQGTSINKALANNGYFVTISTYGTLLIEIAFPFLVWFNITKKIIILLAILMHLSIYVFMMIYDFQIVFIAIMGFYFSNSWWLRLYTLFNQKIQIWTIIISKKH